MWWLMIAACGTPEPPPAVPEVIGHSAPAKPTALNARVDEPFETFANGHDGLTIDVRPAGDYLHGHVPGAYPLPLEAVDPYERHIAAWPKDKPLYVIGETDVDAIKAANALAGAGYHVIAVQGGMEAWISSGYPLDNGPPADEIDDGSHRKVPDPAQAGHY